MADSIAAPLSIRRCWIEDKRAMTVRKTVLITGASGSMGGKARRYLEALGRYDLRLFTYRNPHDDPALVQADLSVWDDSWVRQFEGVDVVLHMAADPAPTSSWDSIQRLDVDMVLNVFLAAVRMKAKRLVFASSNWVLAGHRSITSPCPPGHHRFRSIPMVPPSCSPSASARRWRSAKGFRSSAFVSVTAGATFPRTVPVRICGWVDGASRCGSATVTGNGSSSDP